MELKDNQAAILFDKDGMQLFVPNFSEMEDIGNHLVYAVALFRLLKEDESLKMYISTRVNEMLQNFIEARKEKDNVDEGLSE